MSNPGGYVPGPADAEPYRLQPGERIIRADEIDLELPAFPLDWLREILRKAEQDRREGS